MLIFQFLEYFLILIKSQSQDNVAPIPPPTIIQNFFSQIALLVPELIPQLTTAVQITLPQFLASVFELITESPIFAIANLIPESSPLFLLEIYPIIPPPYEKEYFS